MFLNFFTSLRAAGVPASPREYVTLMEAMAADLAGQSVEGFYHLARACLVKDERHFDKFDRVFSAVFQGLESTPEGLAPQAADVPAAWLEKLAEKYLSQAEKAQIEALGFDKLMETLRQRLAEQQGRHQGGSKWIGTAGTSPFGAYGYHPEGVRIGQEGNRHFRAAKVWDQREFRDLDGDAGLSRRNIRLALRRLRKFARLGAPEELDVEHTIQETANHGYLDVRLRPERRNAVKVLALFDIGGSMDWHVEQAQELFAAAQGEFKHFHHFYFHNCVYESVWPKNSRRHTERVATRELIRIFARDTCLVFVGDAAMSPHEILQPGGSVEHVNAEPGAVWMERLTRAFPRCVWLNPVPAAHWDYTASVGLMRRLVGGAMHPLTLDGIETAMRALAR